MIAASSSTTTRQTVTSTVDDLPQYRPRQIIGIWLAATVPMSLLGWVIASWVSHHIHSRDPFIDSLVVAFDIGLIWMIALALIIVRREQGSLHWPAVRRGLRLNAPRDPRTGLGWRRVWIYAVFFTVSTGLVNMLPLDPQGPLPRDLPSALLTSRVQDYFHPNWVGYGLMVINMFASPVAEELIFRGVLRPAPGPSRPRQRRGERRHVHLLSPAPAVEHADQLHRRRDQPGLADPVVVEVVLDPGGEQRTGQVARQRALRVEWQHVGPARSTR